MKRNFAPAACLSLCFLAHILVPQVLHAQRITYAEPEREDGRRTNFDIIGKIKGNYLVFKNNRSDNVITVYDKDMKAIHHEVLDYLPDKYTNIDFIPYADFSYLLYEYQHKNIVHFTALKIDQEGKKMGESVDLDTTQISGSSNSKIYTSIYSDDKQRIMVFKINSKNQKNFVFTTFLYDAQLNLIDRHRMPLQMEEKSDMFTDFYVSNSGDFVFGKYYKNTSSDYISRISLVTKTPTGDTLAIRDLGAGDRLLDDLKIKIDNNNQHYIFTGFYYKQRRGNIEGLYSVIWDKATDAKLKESVVIFNEQLRALAKGTDANLKMAFNDFFIKHLITKKDGGFLLISESEYSNSRGSVFNRYDYLYGYSPWSTPYDYYSYSPYYSPLYNPWNRFGNTGIIRYHAENIMVLSFDKDGNLEWSNVVPKSQFDDDTDNLISHQIMNTGGELHFLYNQYERRNLLLNDQSVAPDGKITRYPTLRNLDKGYEFMARYGRQVSSYEIIVPCLFRNFLCFAKIEF